MTTARTPKLDPVWMAALGFQLVDDPRIAFLQWRSTKFTEANGFGSGLTVRDSEEPWAIVGKVLNRFETETVRKQQIALRNALLPAMGLEEHSEYDHSGDALRSYIRPE